MLKNIIEKINNEDREILNKKINASINYDSNKYSNPKPDIRIILNKKIRSNSILKDIIKKIENDLNKIISNKYLKPFNMIRFILRLKHKYLPDFKKEAKLQERMIKALIIFCYEFEKCKNENPGTFSMYHYCKNNFIPIIEKYYNKSWEEIIKE